jgi:formiminoglutamate deiminase
MLESGFTRVAEFHYLHHDVAGRPYDDPAEMSARIAAAAHDTGIGLTLLPVFYAHGGFGGTPPSSLQARFVHNPDSYGRLVAACRSAVAALPDAVVGIAPHSLRAATADELRAILPLAEGGPVHIHIAEQIREVEECLAWSGARPVEWLLDRLPVDRRWCLVHATHMSGSEIRRLAESGAVAGLCPITEANLGDGLFPLAPYLAANGRYGVGSDSNVLIDLAEELRWLDYGQRLMHRSRNIAAPGPDAGTGAALFQSALQGGAQALGVAAGFIAGAAADLVALDPDHPALLARSGDRLLDGLVFTGGPRAISSVWRRGRKVVSGGVHYRRAEVLARYREILADLLA